MGRLPQWWMGDCERCCFGKKAKETKDADRTRCFDVAQQCDSEGDQSRREMARRAREV